MDSVFVPKEVSITINKQPVVVHDPSLQKVLVMLRDAKTLLNKLMTFQNLGGSSDMIGEVAEIMSDPEVFKGFCLCASACTDKPASFFEADEQGNGGISLTEAVLLIDALRTAVNWEVLKELFRKMFPTIQAKPVTPPMITN